MKSCLVDTTNNYLYFCTSKGDVVCYDFVKKLEICKYSDKSKVFDMISICPNNLIMVVNDSANNLNFFDIDKKAQIKLLVTKSCKFEIGGHCFNYTGKELIIAEAGGIKVWRYENIGGQTLDEL